MKWPKLTKEEQRIEKAIERGEYVDASKEETEMVLRSLEARRKNAVLNMRVSKQDLDLIKKQAKKLGFKYQTFISEFLHELAHRKFRFKM